MTKLKCQWEVSGGGNLDIDLGELDGMSEDEIDQWLRDGAQLEITEQGNYDISVRWDKEEVMRQLREHEKEMEEEAKKWEGDTPDDATEI